jgi:hypothetical protein
MKAKGITAILNLLASGQYLQLDLYKFSFVTGSVLTVTDADFPVTVGSTVYQGGLIFNRGKITQTNDLSVQSMDLTVSPQFDYPAGVPTVSGVPFLAAVRSLFFDAATVTYYRCYLPIPSGYWAPDFVTYPPIPWFTGIVSDASAGRQSAKLSISNTLELLNVQMPRNLVQTGCLHVLFDAGCGLSKAAFTIAGAVVAGTNGVLSFNTNLTQVDNYFSLGTITFTSGALSGQARTVRASVNSGGKVTVFMPYGSAPAVGDTFNIVPGCDKLQSTCSNNNPAIGPAYNNLLRFRGYPNVPVPETPYTGGQLGGVTPGAAQQGGSSIVGSPGGGTAGTKTYKP